MDPTKYANIGDLQNSRHLEESAPLLDIEQQPAPRLSEDTNPFTDDPLASDDGSSKESRHGDNDRTNNATPLPLVTPQMTASAPSHPIYIDHEGLPQPVTVGTHDDFQLLSVEGAKHVLMIIPRMVLAFMWFGLFLSWTGLSIVYLISWLFLQLGAGFTRVQVDKKLVRRDLGGFFDGMMDLFERIW